jgi:small subunit ribosomal protein S6
LRPYETMLLCDPRREDAEIEQTLEAFAALVTDRGGAVESWDRWGRRRIAYEIDDLSEGYYAVCTYTIDPGKRGEIEAALPFVEGIVRTKTVRREVRTRGA